MAKRETEISLMWDPTRPAEGAGPAGDLEGVLASIDGFLAEDETTFAWGARAITLAVLHRPSEAIATAVRRMMELTDNPKRVPWQLAVSRLLIAELLDMRGERRASVQALGDVASFYGKSDDPLIRAVAAAALAERLRVLGGLGEVDAVAAAWNSLRVEYGAETSPHIRLRVARAGRWAAEILLDANRGTEATRVCDDVIGLYQSDSDPDTRQTVKATRRMHRAARRH